MQPEEKFFCKWLMVILYFHLWGKKTAQNNKNHHVYIVSPSWQPVAIAAYCSYSLFVVEKTVFKSACASGSDPEEKSRISWSYCRNFAGPVGQRGMSSLVVWKVFFKPALLHHENELLLQSCPSDEVQFNILFARRFLKFWERPCWCQRQKRETSKNILKLT